MQEKWVFKSETIKNAKDINTALSYVFDEKKNELEIFLSLYTKLDGALAENIQLVDPIIPSEQSTGSFLLSFNKSFYNACLNINEADLDKIELTYEFNPGKGNLILFGPDIPEREPDDL